MGRRAFVALAVVLSLILGLHVQTHGAGGTNLAAGRSYRVTVSAPSQAMQQEEKRYADTGGKELTNGKLAASTSYTDREYTGWARQGTRTVTLDLGQMVSIDTIQMHFLQSTAEGIYFPAKVSFQTSADGVTWTDPVTVASQIPASRTGRHGQWFTASVNGTGRYVSAQVPVSVWVFTDEIQVWGQPVAAQNVAANRPYRHSMACPGVVQPAEDRRYRDDTGKELTDGKLPAASYQDKGWQGWSGEACRQVVLDLGSNQTVHGVRMHFLRDDQVAIHYPEQVFFDLSVDGSRWQRLGMADAPDQDSRSSVNTAWFGLTGLNLAGRYLRVILTSPGGWVFPGELEVLGARGVAEGLPLATGVTDENSFRSSASVRGETLRQVLIYTGVGRDWNKNQLLPYVVYESKSGFKDSMFNSFLFLSLDQSPSGGSYAEDGRAHPANKQDWQYLLDRYFAPDLQLDALELAVKENGRTLGAGYRPAVFLGIPYPSTRQKSFAPGVSFDPEVASSAQNRINAVREFVQEAVRRFEPARYPHLRLAGFYWIAETVPDNDAERSVIKATADLVHSYPGMTFEWIPYYSATNASSWRELGFDVAPLQPNYAFNPAVPLYRLCEAAIRASHTGTSLEIELDGVERQARSRYQDYLRGGVTYGYMHAPFLAFYQDVRALAVAAGSKDPSVRQVYDDTYRFIKGTYR